MFYRRNSDADIRDLERQALANPGDADLLERYYHAVARTTNHKPTCATVVDRLDFIQEQAAVKLAIANYKAEWPKHCTDCSGWGGKISYYDPSAAGVGLSAGSMQDFDPCDTCLGTGVCPQCGDLSADMVDEGYYDRFICRICGWDDDENMDGMPEEYPVFAPECDCWQDELDAYGLRSNPDDRCSWVQMHRRPLRYVRCRHPIMTDNLCLKHHRLWRNLEMERLRYEGKEPDIWEDDIETKAEYY